MAADTDHARDVIDRAKRHELRLQNALAILSQRVVQLMGSAPLRDGELFDLEWAVNARATISQFVQEEYLAEIDDMIRDYAVVAQQAEAMLGNYTALARLDESVVRQLQQLSFRGLETLGEEFVEAVASQVYANTLTGLPFAQAVEQIQQSVEADLGRYAQVALNDGLMDFDRTITTNMSLEAGATEFKYFGPDDSKTRPHCEKYVGKTMGIEEIREAWSGEWSGKRDGSPFVVAGGYNCRHRFRPVF